MTYYGPTIYTGPVYNTFDAGISITSVSGRGWALETETFLGPVKRLRAVRRVPFEPKKVEIFPPPPHLGLHTRELLVS